MARDGAGAEVVGPAAGELVADRTRGRQVGACVDCGYVTPGMDGRGGPVVAGPADVAEAVAQADVLAGSFRGVGSRADQGRLLGRGVHAGRVRTGSRRVRVGHVGLVDDVAGAVGGLLQDVAVLVEDVAVRVVVA
ncbi:hypothetical protein, partial [Streptomyces olindensis]|uniref:hypothetical protein n=1 Tax=Streptomyces olindensis TaxID=358823 RepID=UPI00365E2A8B